MYLLDTNIIIHYLENEIEIIQRVKLWIQEDTIITSTIVEAELFSWPNLTTLHHVMIMQALATIQIIPVDSEIAQLAASLRRKYKLHLLDGLIAATALSYSAILVTRNLKDFSKVKELEIQKI